MKEGGAFHGGDLFKRPNPFDFGDFVYNGQYDMVEESSIDICPSLLQHSTYIFLTIVYNGTWF